MLLSRRRRLSRCVYKPPPPPPSPRRPLPPSPRFRRLAGVAAAAAACANAGEPAETTLAPCAARCERAEAACAGLRRPVLCRRAPLQATQVKARAGPRIGRRRAHVQPLRGRGPHAAAEPVPRVAVFTRTFCPSRRCLGRRRWVTASRGGRIPAAGGRRGGVAARDHGQPALLRGAAVALIAALYCGRCTCCGRNIAAVELVAAVILRLLRLLRMLLPLFCGFIPAAVIHHRIPPPPPPPPYPCRSAGARGASAAAARRCRRVRERARSLSPPRLKAKSSRLCAGRGGCVFETRMGGGCVCVGGGGQVGPRALQQDCALVGAVRGCNPAVVVADGHGAVPLIQATHTHAHTRTRAHAHTHTRTHTHTHTHTHRHGALRPRTSLLLARPRGTAFTQKRANGAASRCGHTLTAVMPLVPFEARMPSSTSLVPHRSSRWRFAARHARDASPTESCPHQVMSPTSHVPAESRPRRVMSPPSHVPAKSLPRPIAVQCAVALRPGGRGKLWRRD